MPFLNGTQNFGFGSRNTDTKWCFFKVLDKLLLYVNFQDKKRTICEDVESCVEGQGSYYVYSRKISYLFLRYEIIKIRSTVYQYARKQLVNLYILIRNDISLQLDMNNKENNSNIIIIVFS